MIKEQHADTLILCWGNPGRRDDGLGPALAARIGTLPLPGVTLECDYQLHVEHAADVARHRRVLFVDAAVRGRAPFAVERVEPAENGLSFTSHSVTPAALLALARDLFHAEPEAWTVGIRGYDFGGYDEGLSPGARANLVAAADWIGEHFAAVGERAEEGEPCLTTSR